MKTPLLVECDVHGTVHFVCFEIRSGELHEVYDCGCSVKKERDQRIPVGSVVKYQDVLYAVVGKENSFILKLKNLAAEVSVHEAYVEYVGEDTLFGSAQGVTFRVGDYVFNTHLTMRGIVVDIVENGRKVKCKVQTSDSPTPKFYIWSTQDLIDATPGQDICICPGADHRISCHWYKPPERKRGWYDKVLDDDRPTYKRDDFEAHKPVPVRKQKLDNVSTADLIKREIRDLQKKDDPEPVPPKPPDDSQGIKRRRGDW